MIYKFSSVLPASGTSTKNSTAASPAWKTQLTLQLTHISPYTPVLSAWLKCADKAGQVEKLLSPKRSPTGGHDVERVVGNQIGPGSRNGVQTACTVLVEGPVLVPVHGAHDEVELLPKERMERVGYPKWSALNVTKRRS
jgi:hypothetical protein